MFSKSPSELFENIPKSWAAIMVITTAATAGWIGKTIVGDFIERDQEHESRITSLETWRVMHLAEETGPGLDAIARLESRDSVTNARLDSLARDISFIRGMTYQMYCRDWPSRCEAEPARQDEEEAPRGGD